MRKQTGGIVTTVTYRSDELSVRKNSGDVKEFLKLRKSEMVKKTEVNKANPCIYAKNLTAV